MEIMPNSTIKFIKGINFDADYNDTIFFNSIEEQEAYFSDNSRVKYTLTKQMYERHSSGVIKVELPLNKRRPTSEGYESTAEALYDCNYLMFCNESFVNEQGKKKWFYAFLTDVEYVNNEVARVSFEIDVIQTWFFDFDLEQCFVLREHSATDNIGDNLIPENLDVGYNYIEHSSTTWRDEEALVIIVDRYGGGEIPLPIMVRGIMQSLGVAVFDINNQTEFEAAQSFLSLYLDNTSTTLTAEDIITIFQCPKSICYDSTYVKPVSPSDPDYLRYPVGHPNLKPFANNETTISVYRPSHFWYINKKRTSPVLDDSYTPVNNKLFTYPFIYVEANNHLGMSNEYRFEMWNTDVGALGKAASFVVNGEFIPNPTMIISPINYKSSQTVGNNKYNNIELAIATSEYPQNAWVGDTYKAWWAQNRNSYHSSIYFNILGALVGYGSGMTTANKMIEQRQLMDIANNPNVGTHRYQNYARLGARENVTELGAAGGIYRAASSLVSAGSNIASTLAQASDIKNKPPIVGGVAGSSNILTSAGLVGFDIKAMTIPAEQAEVIDAYFSMFGYATHALKTPNIHVREKWTYTQTIGCTVHGKSLPSDAQQAICNIFDHGIRFWNKNATLGEYRDPNTGTLYANACL